MEDDKSDCLHHQKIPPQNAPYSVVEDDQYEDDEAENEVEDEKDDENLIEEGNDEEGDNVEDNDKKVNNKRPNNNEIERPDKKQRLKTLVSNYEFAPRLPLSSGKSSVGRRNSLTDWTEHDTLVLLEAWGDQFLQRGRKSLRSEEWLEVVEKVSEVSKIERTDTQCRNRLDKLKKKYKKEKMKLTDPYGSISKWDYFKKMDMLMSTPPQKGGLSCGFDSGEYVFMNPRAYLNRANGLDEMRDSPGNSDSAGDEEDSDEAPPKKPNTGRKGRGDSPYRSLANSILKFSQIYEKIESRRRQQMINLEKMRIDFHKDLETQKKEIMERAKIEIAKMREVEDE